MDEANAPAPQSLADKNVVYALIFSCVEHHVEELDAFLAGKRTREQCARDDSQLASNLTGILCGALPEHFTPVAGWSGAGLGKFLRSHFAADIAALDPEHRALFEKDDEACVFFAVLKLQKDIAQLIAEENEKGDEEAERSGRRVHDFCAAWADLLTRRTAAV